MIFQKKVYSQYKFKFLFVYFKFSKFKDDYYKISSYIFWLIDIETKITKSKKYNNNNNKILIKIKSQKVCI